MEVKHPALHVLVADDHPDSADCLAALFHLSSPSAVTTAGALDGSQAIEHAQAHQPDVAVLDIEMPLVNGFKAATQLRRLYGTAICRIAVSAREQHVTSAREGSLFDHALSKPIDIATLLRLVATRANRGSRTRS